MLQDSKKYCITEHIFYIKVWRIKIILDFGHSVHCKMIFKRKREKRKVRPFLKKIYATNWEREYVEEGEGYVW